VKRKSFYAARKPLAIAIAMSTCWMVSIPSVYAQGEAGGGAPRLEEVVVTGNKSGAGFLQSVPIAITAVSTEALENTGTNSLREMATLAPSLQVTDSGGLAQIYLRGIGTNIILAGSDASTTMHIDGVYISRPFSLFSQFLDVERIEVLRGPQGTLYGRNSVGGTISVVTREPSDQLEGKVQASYGNFASRRVAGVVSGPLSEDFAGTVSGFYAKSEGRIKNVVPGVNDMDSTDTQGIRGKLRFTPNDQLSLTLAADYAVDSGTPAPATDLFRKRAGFSVPFNETVLNDPYTTASDINTNTHIDQKGLALTADYQLTDELLLRSISAYREDSFATSTDTDGTELIYRYSRNHEDHNQFSQELQTVYSGDGLEAILGAFYFKEKSETDVLLFIPPANQGLHLAPENHTDPAWAIFGQGTMDITDEFALTLGLRYSKETKTVTQSGEALRIAPAAALASFGFKDEISFDDWTPMARLTYTLSPDVMFYMSASKGSKSGGFNASERVVGRGFDPETLKAYEVGVKSTLLEQRLRLNATVYHYDYEDLQVQTIIPGPFIVVTNAAAATIDGVEVEFEAALTDTLRMGGYVNYFDGTYGEYIAIVDGLTSDVEGKDLTQAPRWKAGLNVNYEYPLAMGGALFAYADASWQDTIYFQPNHLLEQKPYAIAGARIGYRSPNDEWQLATFVRNAFDEEYYTSGDTTPQPGYGGRPGVPRTYGVELQYNF
jgi:iron complex outermembrane receptor protein